MGGVGAGAGRVVSKMGGGHMSGRVGGRGAGAGRVVSKMGGGHTGRRWWRQQGRLVVGGRVGGWGGLRRG